MPILSDAVCFETQVEFRRHSTDCYCIAYDPHTYMLHYNAIIVSFSASLKHDTCISVQLEPLKGKHVFIKFRFEVTVFSGGVAVDPAYACSVRESRLWCTLSSLQLATRSAHAKLTSSS